MSSSQSAGRAERAGGPAARTRVDRSAAVVEVVAAAGGVCPVAKLRVSGVSREHIAEAIASRRVSRVRRGWIATPGANPEAVRAVRVGGFATAATVVRMHGIPVPDDDLLHVRVARGASRLRAPDLASSGLRALDRDHDRVCLHHRSDPVAVAAVDPLPLALAELLNCASPETAITVLDAALSSGRLSMPELDEVRALSAPSRHRTIESSDAGSESIIETKVRMLLRSRRIRFRSQAPIADVGRVDLLVGDRLVIEVDGSRFHAGDDEFESDRRRDFELAIRGYLVVRLSYRMVMEHWEATSAQLLGIIARGEHRWGFRARAIAVQGRALPRYRGFEGH